MLHNKRYCLIFLAMLVVSAVFAYAGMPSISLADETPDQVVSMVESEVADNLSFQTIDAAISVDGNVTNATTAVDLANDSVAQLANDYDDVPDVYHIFCQSHVQEYGWLDEVSDGDVAGTIGANRRLEALYLRMSDTEGSSVEGAIRYRAHVQNFGWQDWVSEGELAGTTGQGLSIEAIMIQLVGPLSDTYDLYYRAHIQDAGWLAWTSNGNPAGSAGHARQLEALQIVLLKKGESAQSLHDEVQTAFLGNLGVSLAAHVQDLGWMPAVADGEIAGTTGRTLRIEALSASIDNLPYEGSISYVAHVQNIGWQSETEQRGVAGTVGQSLHIEALRFFLSGELAERYHVWYRVHVADYGWLSWTYDGGVAGSMGLCKRIEAIQTSLVPKEHVGPQDPGYVAGVSFVTPASVSYAVQTTTMDWHASANGSIAGSTGHARGVRGLRASVAVPDGLTGGISYAVSSDGVSWTQDRCDGADVFVGEGAIQGIRLVLSGSLSQFFDLWYHVHVSSFGWEDWTCNGAPAGNAYGLPVEAIEIRLVPRGNGSPGATTYPYFDRGAYCIGQLAYEATGSQQRVVLAARMTPSPGAGLCAGWVEDVIWNAGFGYYMGDARDLYHVYCHSDDLRDLKVGMIVAVARHSHTALGRIYGHVGIYVGNGMLMDNVGGIRTISLKEWMAWYGDLVAVKWGWLGNRVLG